MCIRDRHDVADAIQAAIYKGSGDGPMIVCLEEPIRFVPPQLVFDLLQKALTRVPTVTCGKLRPRKLSSAVCEYWSCRYSLPCGPRTASIANTESSVSVFALLSMNGMLSMPPADSVDVTSLVMCVSVSPASACRWRESGSSIAACVIPAGSGAVRNGEFLARSYSG